MVSVVMGGHDMKLLFHPLQQNARTVRRCFSDENAICKMNSGLCVVCVADVDGHDPRDAENWILDDYIGCVEEEPERFTPETSFKGFVNP